MGMYANAIISGWRITRYFNRPAEFRPLKVFVLITGKLPTTNVENFELWW